MKGMALLLAFLCLPAALCAQAGMSPQYSAYQTVSVNQNTNTAYSTITVQGTTNPYNCYYVCGPGGVQCQIPGCVGAMHTPKILNQYGSIGGWQTGQGQSPGA